MNRRIRLFSWQEITGRAGKHGHSANHRHKNPLEIFQCSQPFILALAQIHIPSSFHAVCTSSKGFVFQDFPLPSVYLTGKRAASGNVCKFFTNAKKFPQFYSMGAGHGSDLGGKLNTGAGREGEARRVRGLFRFPP